MYMHVLYISMWFVALSDVLEKLPLQSVMTDQLERHIYNLYMYLVVLIAAAIEFGPTLDLQLPELFMH